MFCENGYDRKTSQKIINNFEKKTRSISNNNNCNTDEKQTITFLEYQKSDQKSKKKYKRLPLEKRCKRALIQRIFY